MPEVEYRTTMSLPPEKVWEFVKHMNNWAPFLTGYQSHEIQSDTDSVWTLKGDVGILSRTVKLQAHVTEWNGPERVSFTLTGINEQVEGAGTLEISPCTADMPEPAVGRVGLFRRFLNFVARAFFKWVHGRAPEKAPTTCRPPASQLVFTLRMDALGPTGPLVNAMLDSIG